MFKWHYYDFLESSYDFQKISIAAPSMYKAVHAYIFPQHEIAFNYFLFLSIFHRSTRFDMLAESNTRDQNMVDFMIDKWTNFAIFHNPTPTDNSWPTYGTNGITYVRLEDSKLIVKNDKVRDDRLTFWSEIFPL